MASPCVSLNALLFEDDRVRDFQRLDRFLDERLEDIYPEATSELAAAITRQMVPELLAHYNVPQGARVLDVGCGTGLALAVFRDHGCNPVGLGFGEEASLARDKGFDVVEEDMSFTSFPDHDFDLVWCRHVIEHSLFPYFTLSEMHRLLKPGGAIYVEVPSPGTAANHEANPNHYSVFGETMWLNLLSRVGFTDIRSSKIDFEIPVGKDAYLVFDAQKSDQR